MFRKDGGTEHYRCRRLFRFLDNYEPIDFGNDCQATPRAVQLSERVDELDRSLLAVVTAILVAKMDNANLVAYRCICIHRFHLFMCFPVSGLNPAEEDFSAGSSLVSSISRLFRFPTLSEQCEDPVVDVVIRIR